MRSDDLRVTLNDLGRRLEGIQDPLGEPPDELRFAAVIGLLLDREQGYEQPSLLLIERPRSMRHHAGQLAFPGGKPERGDVDLLHTALREAWEEVGLPRDQVQVMGRLNPVPTPTGFMIVPYVGRVQGAWRPRASEREVARVLTPPLRTLMDPSVYNSRGTLDWRGTRYEMHEYRIAEPPLWGATARMVWDLLDRLDR